MTALSFQTQAFTLFRSQNNDSSKKEEKAHCSTKKMNFRDFFYESMTQSRLSDTLSKASFSLLPSSSKMYRCTFQLPPFKTKDIDPLVLQLVVDCGEIKVIGIKIDQSSKNKQVNLILFVSITIDRLGLFKVEKVDDRNNNYPIKKISLKA